MGKLVILLLSLPVVDLYLLVRLGREFGAGFALGLVLVSGLIGLVLGRVVGLRQLQLWRAALAEQRAPSQGVVHALLLLVACGLFIAPGVISDVMAVLLLLPPVRRVVVARLANSVRDAVEQGSLHVMTQVQMPQQPNAWSQGMNDAVGRRGHGRDQDAGVIDVEGEDVTREQVRKPLSR
jgi:UPF0716 family protein affecting phage T7 exclusion